MRVARLLGCIKCVGKLIECSGLDSVTNALHVLLVVREIVDGAQLRAQNLVATIKMVQISATKVRTGVALTVFIKRARAYLMARIAQFNDAVAREEMPIARVACGHHAVEHIDTTAHRLE